MTNLRQAAQQALQALMENGCLWSEKEKAVRLLQAALTEPEQEPVAWMAPDGSIRKTPTAKSFNEWKWARDDFKPLYTAPTPRRPLTDEEMRECAQAMDAEPLAEGWPELIKFARAIERAHGIAPKAAQEP